MWTIIVFLKIKAFFNWILCVIIGYRDQRNFSGIGCSFRFDPFCHSCCAIVRPSDHLASERRSVGSISDRRRSVGSISVRYRSLFCMTQYCAILRNILVHVFSTREKCISAREFFFGVGVSDRYRSVGSISVRYRSVGSTSDRRRMSVLELVY